MSVFSFIYTRLDAHPKRGARQNKTPLCPNDRPSGYLCNPKSYVLDLAMDNEKLHTYVDKRGLVCAMLAVH